MDNNTAYGRQKHDAEEDAYLTSLTPKERAALDIAKSHLGMSFSLAKSNGFLAWKKIEADPGIKRKCVVEAPPEEHAQKTQKTENAT